MFSLLDLEPDFTGLLPVSERALAARVSVSVYESVAGGGIADVSAELEAESAFGAVVLQGLVAHRLSLRGQVSLRVLGPGDVVVPGHGPGLPSVDGSELTAQPGTQLALLGETFVTAMRRWPGLTVRLLDRLAESLQMLEAQLVICQLPRVDQRLMTMLWLLAERWGRVTPSGTFLPFRLTHENLGALTGAARSTVTLALAELTERGALVRQREGWLLLEPPPQSAPIPTRADTPRLRSPTPSGWEEPTSVKDGSPEEAVALSEALRRSRQYERDLAIRQRNRARALRERALRLRTAGVSSPAKRTPSA